jgi:hypothetical protein
MRREHATIDGARGSSEGSVYPHGQLQYAVTWEEEAEGIRMDDCFFSKLAGRASGRVKAQTMKRLKGPYLILVIE